MDSLFKTIAYVLILYAFLTGFFFLLSAYRKNLKNKKTKAALKKTAEEAWDKMAQRREKKFIEIKNSGALADIKAFLKDKYSDYKFLSEVVVPEFNNSAPLQERLPANLSEKKLHKTILEKAEEYWATNNPLLEILAESFLASRPKKHKP